MKTLGGRVSVEIQYGWGLSGDIRRKGLSGDMGGVSVETLGVKGIRE